MSNTKPKNNMEAARAALARKKEMERLQKAAAQNPVFVVPPPVHPKKRTRSISSSSSWDDEDEDEEESPMSLEDRDTSGSVHPLKAKGVSLELVPVPPVPKRIRPSKPPKKKVKQQEDASDNHRSTGWGQSIASIGSSFGQSVADAIPKLVVMAAGLAVTVALQAVTARSDHSNNSIIPHVVSDAPNPPVHSPHIPVLSAGVQPTNDFPSFISSR